MTQVNALNVNLANSLHILKEDHKREIIEQRDTIRQITEQRDQLQQDTLNLIAEQRDYMWEITKQRDHIREIVQGCEACAEPLAEEVCFLGHENA